MADGPPSGLVWTLVALLGLGTYGLRLSFIELRGWVESFPPWLEPALAYVPAAVLAALVAPALVSLDAGLTGVLNARALAGALAAVVAWRTGSMLATIGAGMAVVWAAALVG